MKKRTFILSFLFLLAFILTSCFGIGKVKERYKSDSIVKNDIVKESNLQNSLHKREFETSDFEKIDSTISKLIIFDYNTPDSTGHQSLKKKTVYYQQRNVKSGSGSSTYTAESVNNSQAISITDKSQVDLKIKSSVKTKSYDKKIATIVIVVVCLIMITVLFFVIKKKLVK